MNNNAGVCHVEGATEKDKPTFKQTLISSYNTLLAPQVKAAASMDNSLETPTKELEKFNAFHNSSRNPSRTDLSTWFNQFIILIHRGLKERKHESFNTLRVFQVITAAILAGLMWWHSDYRDIQDRLGLLFFFSIFWGVFPSFNAAFAFPSERAIFVKERASGMYTLSSYFMARIVGDMPMELVLPTVFLTVAYWMAGLKADVGAFLLTLVVLLGYVLVSQGLGLALGAAIMDAKQASTIVTVTMLLFVLTGGFYVHKVPACLSWIKYISTTYYSYKLLINIQYGEGERISSLLGCHRRGIHSSDCKFVEEDVGGQIRPIMSVGILLFMFFGYRVLAYLALRRVRA